MSHTITGVPLYEQQEPKSCWYACARMIAKYHKKLSLLSKKPFGNHRQEELAGIPGISRALRRLEFVSNFKLPDLTRGVSSIHVLDVPCEFACEYWWHTENIMFVNRENGKCQIGLSNCAEWSIIILLVAWSL